MHRCRVCGGAGGDQVTALEMMFGTREPFDYFVCSSCECLQIVEIPSDLSAYYPRDYYSFAKPKVSGRIKRAIRSRRMASLLGARGYFWSWVNRITPRDTSWLWWARKANIGLDSRILDVGCGAGQLLVDMSNWGFRQLNGVEPHIDSDVRFSSGVHIQKGAIGDVKGAFELIMFHHSFEHMSEPLSVLRNTSRLLAPGAQALVRIPVADSEAWHTYGTDWVQLDAPRHLFLHTRKSIQVLAEQAELKVEEVIFDSSDFQFWGSELYRRGIPLRDPVTHRGTDHHLVFSEEERQNFSARAQELNERGRGDQACFFLRKPR